MEKFRQGQIHMGRECVMMTRQEVVEEIEEYIRDADKAISDDEEFIHGWKSAMLTCLELVMNLETDSCRK